MVDFVAVSDRLVEAYNQKNFEALRSICAPDLDMAHFNRGFEIKRFDELAQVLEVFAGTLMPNRRFQAPERVQSIGNVVIREGYWGGTAAVDIPGFGAAGEEVRLKLCSVLRFDDNGILVEWKDYG